MRRKSPDPSKNQEGAGTRKSYTSHPGATCQSGMIEARMFVNRKNGKGLATRQIDQQVPYYGDVNPHVTANIYEISKDCGTELPPGF